MSRMPGSNAGGGASAPTAFPGAPAKRHRVWKVIIGANVFALIAAIAGCLFMTRSHGLQADVAAMRDEVGETMTMMSRDSVGEAFTRHIPRLIATVSKWDGKFAERLESFRGLDAEIDYVQDMYRLGRAAERWRSELEGTAPEQRNELWRASIKAKVEEEQRKWPNIVHRKRAFEWMLDLAKEFWFGMEISFTWPVDIYGSAAEGFGGDSGTDKLDLGDKFHYILFPYRLSEFTMFRLGGIAFATSALGYLMCWLGLKTRFGWLSYLGLLYFLYLVNIALFIVWLEVTL